MIPAHVRLAVLLAGPLFALGVFSATIPENYTQAYEAVRRIRGSTELVFFID
jgi:hypothetical protein